MDFLTQQNRLVGGEPLDGTETITAEGKSVVVIGGGDTGSDCIGTSWRQGARQVVQLEILPEPPVTRAESTPWPQWPLMRRDSSSHKEGDTQRYWSVDTTAFAGEAGLASERVQCARVEWAFDESRGQTCPRAIPGSDFELEADLVLLAMGFVAPGPTDLVEHLRAGEGSARLRRARRPAHDERRGRLRSRRHAEWSVTRRARHRRRHGARLVRC